MRIIIINKNDYLVLWSGVDRRDWHLPGNVAEERLGNVVLKSILQWLLIV